MTSLTPTKEKRNEKQEFLFKENKHDNDRFKVGPILRLSYNIIQAELIL